MSKVIKNWVEYRIAELELKQTPFYKLEDIYHYSLSVRLREFVNRLVVETFFKEVTLPNAKKVCLKNKRT